MDIFLSLLNIICGIFLLKIGYYYYLKGQGYPIPASRFISINIGTSNPQTRKEMDKRRRTLDKKLKNKGQKVIGQIIIFFAITWSLSSFYFLFKDKL